MVGIGEFSPNNPKLLKAGKPILGLGEYDEARKILLEQHRKENQTGAKKEKKKTKKKEKKDGKVRKSKPNEDAAADESSEERSGYEENDGEGGEESEETESENEDGSGEKESDFIAMADKPNPLPLSIIPDCSKPGPEVIEEVKKWEQETYKEELDKQVEEKERLLREKRDAEEREEQERERIFQEQQRKLKEEYEREVNSRKFFLWQRKQRAELLKQKLDQLQKEAEERKALRRAERMKLKSFVSQSNNVQFNDPLMEDRYRTRSVSPTLLAPLSPPLCPSKFEPLRHLKPVTTGRNADKAIIIDSPHDLSVKPNIVLDISPTRLDPQTIPIKPSNRSRRLQEIDSSKSYKLIGETTSPYGFERSRRILTQLGQFRKQLQFGNKFNKI